MASTSPAPGAADPFGGSWFAPTKFDGNVEATDDLKVQGRLATGGLLTAQSLDVATAAAVAGDLSVAGALRAAGLLSAGGLDLSGDAAVDGNASVGGSLRAAGLLASDSALVASNATVGGLLVANSACVEGILRVGGLLSADGGLAAASAAVVSDASVGGGLRVGGLLTANGGLKLAGPLSADALAAASAAVAGDAAVGGSLRVDGTLAAASASVGGDAAVGGSLRIAGPIYADGGLKLTGELRAASLAIDGDAALGSTSLADLAVAGAASLARAEVGGDLVCLGATSVRSFVAEAESRFLGDVETAALLRARGGAAVEGGLTVEAFPEGAAFVSRAPAVFSAGVEVDGVLSVRNSLEVDGDLTVDGQLNVLNLRSELVSLPDNSSDTVQLAKTSRQGAFLFLVKGEGLGGATGIFACASSRDAENGNVQRIGGSPGQAGEVIDARWDANSNVVLFHSRVRDGGTGALVDYRVTIIAA